MLTASHLRRIFPNLSPTHAATYAPWLSAAMLEAGIDTRPRVAAFLAQLGHESQGLHYLREIWGPTTAQRHYEGRKDLGNIHAGDGRRFMGRGGLQRTGRANYARAQEALGLPLLTRPELLEDPANAFRSDALYWTDKHLNSIADRLTLKADDRDLATFDRITKIVNGGYNGREDRQRRYAEIVDNLPAELFTTAAAQVHVEQVQTSAPVPPPVPTAAPAPATSDASDDSLDAGALVDKLKDNDTAKAAAAGIGARLARNGGLLTAALGAGQLKAWIGVSLFILIVGIFVYYEGPAVKRALLKRIKK